MRDDVNVTSSLIGWAYKQMVPGDMMFRLTTNNISSLSTTIPLLGLFAGERGDSLQKGLGMQNVFTCHGVIINWWNKAAPLLKTFTEILAEKIYSKFIYVDFSALALIGITWNDIMGLFVL